MKTNHQSRKSEEAALPALSEAERSRRTQVRWRPEKSEEAALPALNDAERSRRTQVRWRPEEKRRGGFADPERC
jgi:hypothetical protein